MANWGVPRNQLVFARASALARQNCHFFWGKWVGCLAALSRHKARNAPELLRASAAMAWHRRWMNLLSVAAQVSFSETLVAPGSSHLTELGAEPPPLGDLSAEYRGADPPPSRLGPR